VWREKWARFLPLIERHGIKPILGIIPDNQDRKLNLSPPDANFWAQMRALESAGATIALHGYQHLCDSTGKSMLGLHRKSEFAGISRDMQRNWIQNGLRILREQGLKPTVWIAPRHGFDELTLSVLRGEGVHVLSDGFARMPFLRQGVTWIPQQLWSPVKKQKGLWTICIHPNTVGEKLVTQLDRFLQGNGAQFTSVERVLEEMRPGKLPLSELIYERVALWRAQRRHRQRRKRAR
jgi:predicted deacetylase